MLKNCSLGDEACESNKHKMSIEKDARMCIVSVLRVLISYGGDATRGVLQLRAGT